ncbi:conserved hypothetical protein [Verticillium alfalfae VaMs.102]|uniref:RRM domain-containing protein n=1 Tax=Verticillium alfalfae (strain VaMs.102 / ATCC MYA-4576 / FGSC 10136) TaxID=526221 RepID=C9SAH9_VERA1|nr:conserved hypothetical protein [Verticillium alfalfae VaMs.102]EEY15427.1 conserved hypothetical protein [Verticillium alfalfae VaMs.102]
MQDSQASRKANGVLPMPANSSATDAPSASRSNKSKTPVEGDKVSQDPAKSSRPGRLYLHVKKRESLAELDEIVQTRTWEDAKLTHNNPCLVGPPSLEYCIYKKIPGARKRSDARQGTIDQDPEFMSYLLSLTNPETEKEGETGEDPSAGESKPDTKVTTTPLIEYIKEKKANRAKEAAAAKSAKHARQESQSTKNSKANADDGKKSKRDRDGKSNKSPEKPKETVRILTKKATAEAAKAAESAASQINEATAAAASSSEAPKSRRANIAAAARLLQRDLGLSPGSAHRRARLNAAKTEAESKTSSIKEASTAASEATPAASSSTPSPATAAQSAEKPATPTAPKSGRSRRGGGGGKNSAEAKNKGAENTTAPAASAPAKTPVVLLRKKETAPAPQAAAATTAATTTSETATPAAAAAAAAAGPNRPRHPQGVTEALLKATLETFGVVTFVEIDRRKGFAYVDFADHASLVRAITGSPVTVAQGTVQVLERKEKKPAGGGGGGGGGGTAAAASSSAAASGTGTAAPAASTTTATPAASSSSGPAEKTEHTGSGEISRWPPFEQALPQSSSSSVDTPTSSQIHSHVSRVSGTLGG